jgi:DNA adenine methylase Dam
MDKYLQTPFNYTGSKYKILEQLLPEFDYTKQIFVDAFCGGGSVFTNVLDKYEKVYANDIITDLTKVMKHMLNDKDDFLKILKTNYVVGKEDQEAYVRLRSDYNHTKDQHTHIRLFSLILHCTNNMLRFSQKFEFNQTFGKRTYNSSTEQKINEWVDYVNLITNRNENKKLSIVSKSFETLIGDFNENQFKNTMFYFDPPYGYIKDGGNIGKKQISEAGYNAYWKQKDELELYKTLKYIDSNGGSFAISGVIEHDGNICWILDKLTSEGFKIIEFNHDYNKVARNKIDKGTKEVLVKNY